MRRSSSRHDERALLLRPTLDTSLSFSGELWYLFRTSAPVALSYSFQNSLVSYHHPVLCAGTRADSILSPHSKHFRSSLWGI